MRLLITGGSGYLGQHLVPLAAQSHQLLYTWLTHDPLAAKVPISSFSSPGSLGTGGGQRNLTGRQLDVRDEAAVRQLVSEWGPQAIIHLAGSNRAPDSLIMQESIVQGTTHVAAAAAAIGARLIHLSTDVLFDGRQAPYQEAASPSPIHPYGRAKAAAEAIISDHPNYVIVRTSLIYGLRRMDWSTRWLVEALQAGRPAILFTNQLRQPTWVETLCRACLELAEADYCGILHVAGRQAMSRAEFGLKMLAWWGVHERSTLHLAADDGSRWPLDCRLDISLASRILKTPLPGFDEVAQTQDLQTT